VTTRFANLDEMLMDPGKHPNDVVPLRSGGGSSDLIVGRGDRSSIHSAVTFPLSGGNEVEYIDDYAVIGRSRAT